MPIVLSRDFLATERDNIDLLEEKLTLGVGKENEDIIFLNP